VTIHTGRLHIIHNNEGVIFLTATITYIVDTAQNDSHNFISGIYTTQDESEVANSEYTVVTSYIYSAAAISLTSLITVMNLLYPSSVVMSVTHLSAGTVSVT